MILDLQRRLAPAGAIRIGHRVPTGATNRQGDPVYRPEKLDTFRVTSPYRDVIEAVRRIYGPGSAEVRQWRNEGRNAPEWEVVLATDTGDPVRQLPVRVLPGQRIDPWYEAWGRRFLDRRCDGQTEQQRQEPCLCRRWGNHEHRYTRQGVCMLCGIAEGWSGPAHVHEFTGLGGTCETCGCHRVCKPTTRVSLLIDDVPAIGQFKVESHGFNAAAELPAIASVVAEATAPIPATLGMRFEERTRWVTRGGRTVLETQQFEVPELRFDRFPAQVLFAPAQVLQAAIADQWALPAGPTRVLSALSATTSPIPQPADQHQQADQQTPTSDLTPDQIMKDIAACTTADAVANLWRRLAAADVVATDELKQVITARGAALRAAEQQEANAPTNVIIGEVMP